MKRVGFFALAGAVGFAVDVGVLALLLALTSLGPFIARLIAIASAMAVTWLINRRFTFDDSPHSLAKEGARYGGVGLSSALLNYLVYSGIILALPRLYPVLAVAASSFIAAAWSDFGYSRFVFGGSSGSK